MNAKWLKYKESHSLIQLHFYRFCFWYVYSALCMKNLSVKIAHLNCIIIHNTYTPWEKKNYVEYFAKQDVCSSSHLQGRQRVNY